VSKKNPAGNDPAWEKRFKEWATGKTLSAISTAGEKPVLPTSVYANILDAAVQGRFVDWSRLLSEAASIGIVVGTDQIEALELAAAGKDVMTAAVTLSVLVGSVPGMEWYSTVEFSDRSDEQKAEATTWNNAARLFLTLKRCGWAGLSSPAAATSAPPPPPPPASAADPYGDDDFDWDAIGAVADKAAEARTSAKSVKSDPDFDAVYREEDDLEAANNFSRRDEDADQAAMEAAMGAKRGAENAGSLGNKKSRQELL
jgi:hypothetical protein